MPKLPIRTPLTVEQRADAERLRGIYKKRVSESKARGDNPPLNQTEVGEQCGWKSPQSTVSQFMTGKVALNLEALVKLAEVLNFEPVDVSPTLATGIRRAPASRPIDTAREAANTPLLHGSEVQQGVDSQFELIPQYTARVAAGDGSENPHVEIKGSLAFKKVWLKAKRLRADKLKVIYAEGRSMLPTISDGDVILLDETRTEPADGELFGLKLPDGKDVVKRLRKDKSGEWQITSDNPEFKPFGFSDEDGHEVKILGRVVWRGGDL